MNNKPSVTVDKKNTQKNYAYFVEIMFLICGITKRVFKM